MAATIISLPPPHERPRSSVLPPCLTSDRVAVLAEYRLAFAKGVLSYGANRVPLVRQEALDLAEGIYWCVSSSTKGKPSVYEHPGITVTARGSVVELSGFGPPIRGCQLTQIMRDLHAFYLDGRRV